MPLRHWQTHKKLLLWPVGTLCLLSSALFDRVFCNRNQWLQLTIDFLLGAGKVNSLDTASLLELACNSRPGSSSSTSPQRRDKGALLGRSSSQLPGGLAESAGDRS
jgi:hypothetical protein